MTYIIKFRRHNKERYWEVEKTDDLYDFKELLEKIFRNTKEMKLEVIIFKKKLEGKG